MSILNGKVLEQPWQMDLMTICHFLRAECHVAMCVDSIVASFASQFTKFHNTVWSIYFSPFRNKRWGGRSFTSYRINVIAIYCLNMVTAVMPTCVYWSGKSRCDFFIFRSHICRLMRQFELIATFTTFLLYGNFGICLFVISVSCEV